MTERTATIRRRATTVPAVLGLAIVVVVGLPLWLFVAAAADIATGRPRLPRARLLAFSAHYLVNEVVEIVLAPLLWAAAGFGTRLRSDTSIRRHERLQRWSLELLARRADRLLGLRLDIDDTAGADTADLGSPPVIVISRHVSVLDSTLPALVYGRRGVTTRGVIMAELLADPGFDLIYQRIGSVFIPRDDGPRARAAIRSMTAVAPERSAFLVFPEGRLATTRARQRSLARLAERDPERAERLAGLQHSLPPRPGGLNELLDALPGADVVVVDHHGLDGIPRLADLVDVVPFEEPIRVTTRRIERDRIPVDADDRVRWLDELWLDLDRRVDLVHLRSPRAT